MRQRNPDFFAMINISRPLRAIISLGPRTWLLIGFLSCIGMELSAIYFQFVLELEPCPLCITQRLIVMALGLIFLGGFMHNPGPSATRVYFALAALASLTGAAVATYHFVIQLLPHAELSSCGPGAAYILEHFSLADGIRLFLTGTGDCTQIVWTLFGLSMPFWVAVSFLGLLALCVWQCILAVPAAPALAGEPAVGSSE